MQRNRIKVLIVASKLRIGGAEKVAADIGFYADRDRFDIHYLVFGDEVGAYEPELEAKDCKVIHIPEPSESFIRYIKNLRLLIKHDHYDVIHAHTMFNIGWAMLAGKLWGVPVRISHSHSALLETRGLKTRLYEAVMRFFILTCSTELVSCGVKAGERLYGKRAFSKRGELILNGIETANFSYSEERRNDIRSKLGLSEAFVIGHAGHLAKVKNQQFLIELMPKILKAKPNAFLLLLGEGDDRPLLEQRINELGLNGYIRLTGNVRNVGDYLSAMDVFAFPSLYEGMPLTLIEAQSNGLPCVISDHVPHDVFITDLVNVLPLDNADEWLNTIVAAERHEPQKYADIVRSSGFDVSSAMDKIYKLYGKCDRND